MEDERKFSCAFIYDDTHYRWWRNPIKWWRHRKRSKLIGWIDLNQDVNPDDDSLTITFGNPDEHA